LALKAFSPSTSSAQDYSVHDSLLVTAVVFSGNDFFSNDDLSLYVRTRRNRRLIGVPGLMWWRWLYQFGSGPLGGGAVGRVFMATGEPPALFNDSVLQADLEQLRLFYEREGFRQAKITASVFQESRADRVRVEFVIDEGPATYIRNFNYVGLDELSAEEKRDIYRNSLLSPGELDPEDSLSWRPRRLRYSEPMLEEERLRLIRFLRNQGYAVVTRDSIHGRVFPARPDSFDFTLFVNKGPRFRFGDVNFVVTGPQDGVASRSDSTFLDSSDPDIPGGKASARFTTEKKLNFGLLKRTLQFRPGDQYDLSRLLATKRRLDASGVFSFTAVETPVSDSTYSGEIRLNHQLNLQTRIRHRFRFETFMLQRSGDLADTDNELGAGLGVTYSNLNLFGGGEAFQLGTKGSLAADIGGLGGFTSAQWEMSASLSYPYLTFPLGRLDRLSNLYDAKSQISFSLLAARRDALLLTLRGRGGARYRFELRHTESLSSIIDMIDITVSNPDTLDGFQDLFLNDILGSVDDPVQQAQIIEDYTRPHFNNALSYTIRSSTSDPFRRETGHFREASVEFGGNLGRLLDGFVFTPGKVEGSLPGFGVFGGSGQNTRMIYRQYLRLATDLRGYSLLNSRTVLAWKFLAGFAHPTGASDVVPFDRRFYSGGASSVRAWRLRELGPGSARFTSDTDSLVSATDGSNILGGDIKLEASVELRTVAIRNLIGADWIFTMFADAGNVWLGPRNPGASAGRFRIDKFAGELGIGAGIGLRLGWDYLIVRLDLAYKVHDPRRRGEIFPDQLKKPVLQFGIGHTF